MHGELQTKSITQLVSAFPPIYHTIMTEFLIKAALTPLYTMFL